MSIIQILQTRIKFIIQITAKMYSDRAVTSVGIFPNPELMGNLVKYKMLDKVTANSGIRLAHYVDVKSRIVWSSLILLYS